MTRHIQYPGPAAATTITKPRSNRRRRLISTISRTVTATSPISNMEEGTITSTATSSTLINAEEVAAWSLVMYHHDPADNDEEKDEEKDEAVKEKSSLYKCNKCPKRFGSYQALGGHHAGHSKNSASKLATLVDEGENNDDDDDDEDYKGDEDDEDYDDEEKNVVKKREFKCPFCPRVFWSGQALGGHKKVHYKVSSTTSSRRPMIDLNLPPPVDDDEDVE